MKKSTKWLVIILIIFGLVSAGVVGIFAYWDGQVKEIVEEINSSDPSTTTIEDDYEALTPIGQKLFREKIIAAFVDMVSENVYKELSDKLVNGSALDKYVTYEKIGKILNITSDDGTNVMSHIDTVLELESYEKYDKVCKCIANSIEDYTDCMEYVSDAGDASTYYGSKYYIGRAYLYADSALASAEEYLSSDSLCVSYVDALTTIEEGLYDLYYDYSSYSSSSVKSAISTVNDIISDATDAKKNVENIVNRIPQID